MVSITSSCNKSYERWGNDSLASLTPEDVFSSERRKSSAASVSVSIASSVETFSTEIDSSMCSDEKEQENEEKEESLSSKDVSEETHNNNDVTNTPATMTKDDTTNKKHWFNSLTDSLNLSAINLPIKINNNGLLKTSKGQENKICEDDDKDEVYNLDESDPFHTKYIKEYDDDNCDDEHDSNNSAGAESETKLLQQLHVDGDKEDAEKSVSIDTNITENVKQEQEQQQHTHHQEEDEENDDDEQAQEEREKTLLEENRGKFQWVHQDQREKRRGSRLLEKIFNASIRNTEEQQQEEEHDVAKVETEESKCFSECEVPKVDNNSVTSSNNKKEEEEDNGNGEEKEKEAIADRRKQFSNIKNEASQQHIWTSIMGHLEKLRNNESSTSNYDDDEISILQEELKTTKLEYATVLTHNDHAYEKLNRIKNERDWLRSQYIDLQKEYALVKQEIGEYKTLMNNMKASQQKKCQQQFSPSCSSHAKNDFTDVIKFDARAA